MRFTIIFTLLFLAGCITNPVIQRPPAQVHQAQSNKFSLDIRKIIKNGDWIVTRGYHAIDHLVANATGMPLSHAAIYDAEQDQLIEAEATPPVSRNLSTSHTD